MVYSPSSRYFSVEQKWSIILRKICLRANIRNTTNNINSHRRERRLTNSFWTKIFLHSKHFNFVMGRRGLHVFGLIFKNVCWACNAFACLHMQPQWRRNTIEYRYFEVKVWIHSHNHHVLRVLGFVSPVGQWSLCMCACRRGAAPSECM